MLRPESVQKKKSWSVCYHAVCESVSMDESLVGHIASSEYITDLTIKVTYWKKWRHLGSDIW